MGCLFSRTSKIQDSSRLGASNDPVKEQPPCPAAPPVAEDPEAADAGPPTKSRQYPPEAPVVLDGEPTARPAADVMAAPGQVLDDVAGAAQALHSSVGKHIEGAAALREEWMSSITSKAENLSENDVDLVLDGTEKLVHLFRSACGKGQQQDKSAPPDIQSLELPKRSPVEQGLAKYSALGQVLIDMAGPAMQAMPFGAPAAAVLGAVYARAAQAAQISYNCVMLLGLMKSVDAQLARVMDSLASGRVKAPSGVESVLQELLLQIVQGGRLMQDYAKRGFILRFILSKGDERRFAELDHGIHQSMEWFSFCVSMELLASPASYQRDESAPLRAAVCSEAGMPEDQAEEALCQLSQSQPEKLRELVQQHGSFSMHVLSSEMGCIAERVRVIEERVHGMHSAVQVVDGRVQGGFQEVGGKVDLVLQQIAQAISRQEELKHTQLAAYLKDWWYTALGKQTWVSVDTFFQKLIAWFKGNNLLSKLLEYEEDMARVCPANMLQAASKKICVEEGGQTLTFLSIVVLPLLDTNQDDAVDRTELLSLQVQAEEYARQLGEPVPSALVDLLEVIFLGFDLDTFVKKAHFATGMPEIDVLSQALKVTPILQSYNVHLLLESHVPGTRQWLFDRVNNWLEAALSAGADAGPLNRHRMFLLLAGPGMGKSVFSAVMEKKLVVRTHAGQRLFLVRHFFKVGEPRAQGKAMVLCLAMQLAEQLPGMATLLQPVVKQHGCANQLSLQDTFDKFLLEPLTEVDKACGVEQYVVIMLLDAIDEAADGAMGSDPVANLVGNQMSKLPAWVKIVLTGRPQMESCFLAWEPSAHEIEPSAHENIEDMRMLLMERLLQDGKIVSPVDLRAAVEVMQRKSEGQFIWAKHALDELCNRNGLWTPAEMETALPSGLFGMYRHIMEVLQDALREENPDALTLLHQQLLPILVATKSPLSPQQLAVMAGAQQHQVDLLLRLLVNMFPVRLQNGTEWQQNGKVVPYHKSVLDWLVEDPQFYADAGRGHEYAGKACFAAVMANRVSPTEIAKGGDSNKKTSSHPSASILEYALRYGVTHLCLANGCIELLEGLILDFSGLWPMAFTEGCGAELLKDLIALGPKRSAVVKDVVRWLRLTSSFLLMHPRAALQLACDSPHNTVVAKHANSLPEQPQAKLMTKEQDWHACLSTLTGHKKAVTSVAVGAGTIISGAEDESIRVWDLENGTCKATLAGHSRPVTSVALSYDARTCVSGSYDETLRVWDLENGTCKATLAGHSDWVTSVALSYDDGTCVSGSLDRTLRVWDLENGTCKATLAGHRNTVTGVALSYDARTCVSGSWDRTLRVWDLENGTCKATLAGHSDRVTSVALSYDARTCVSGSEDKTLRVWDLENGTCKATLAGHSDMVTGVALSYDDGTCVSGSLDRTLRKWDLTTGEQLACYDKRSKEGAQLRALADSWRDGCNLSDAGDGAACNDVAWVGNTAQTIHWGVDEASSSSANAAVGYLMPPIFINEFGLLYNKSSRRVGFFDAVSNQFIRYQLLT